MNRRGPASFVASVSLSEQAAVAGEDASVVAVVVEGVYLAPRAHHPQQHAARRGACAAGCCTAGSAAGQCPGGHRVRRRAAVDQPVLRMVGLGRDIHRTGTPGLQLRGPVDVDVDLAQEEQVLAVVAGRRVGVGGGRTPGGRRCGAHDQGPVEAHLHLEVRPRPAVVEVGPGLAGRERVGHGPARRRLLGQEARNAARRRRDHMPREHDRDVARGRGQGVRERDLTRLARGDLQRGSRELHRGAGAVAPGVDRASVGDGDVPGARGEVEAGAADDRQLPRAPRGRRAAAWPPRRRQRSSG